MKFIELKKQLDSYRGSATRIELSKDQIEFLKLCREHEAPISYRKMSELWEKLGWGKLDEFRINRIYNKQVKSKAK